MDIKALLESFLDLVNDSLIPFLLLVAFLVFIWNVTHYFIIGGSNEDGQTKARSLAIWGIGAFVVLSGIWGIVNVVQNILNLDSRAVVPDYMCEKSNEGDCREGIDVDNLGDFNEPVNFDSMQYTS